MSSMSLLASLISLMNEVMDRETVVIVPARPTHAVVIELQPRSAYRRSPVGHMLFQIRLNSLLGSLTADP